MNDKLCETRYNAIESRVERLEHCIERLTDTLSVLNRRVRDLFWLVVILGVSRDAVSMIQQIFR